MEAKLINLEDWEQFGEGGVGTSYFNKNDESLILKLNVEGWPEERTYGEYSNSKNVYETGVNTPKVYDYVTDGKRYGYTAQRIKGKKSYSRMLADEPSKLVELAKLFAAEAKKLHSTECNTAVFSSPLTAYKKMIDECSSIPQDIRQKLQRLYEEHNLNATTCIHGDLQMGNLIVSEGKEYWIDLGGFGYGDPVIDLANMYLIGFILPAQMVNNLFHISRRKFHKFYYAFLEAYYGAKPTEQQLEHIKHAALFRAGVCIAAKPQSATLFLPAIREQRVRFAVISFLACFAKAEV